MPGAMRALGLCHALPLRVVMLYPYTLLAMEKQLSPERVALCVEVSFIGLVI